MRVLQGTLARTCRVRQGRHELQSRPFLATHPTLLHQPCTTASRCGPIHSSAAPAAAVAASQALVPVQLQPVALPEGSSAFPYYSQYPLDRKAEWRSSPDKLHAAYTDPRAALLLVSKDKCLVTRVAAEAAGGEGSASQGSGGEAGWKLLLLSPAAQAHSLLLPGTPANDSGNGGGGSGNDGGGNGGAAEGGESVEGGVKGDEGSPATSVASAEAATQAAVQRALFLGVDASGAPVFAIDVADGLAPAAAALASAWLTGASATGVASGAGEWKAARSLELSAFEGSLAATAVGLAQWNRVALFQSSTGAPLEPLNGGFARRPAGSRRSVWPRIDPAVIMLTTAGSHNEWCLLGRKPEWPDGRYSTLAGFVELGEPLEMTVAREVEEESGVPVHLPSVRYVVSQPWPFPRSLMIGFYCQAKKTQSDNTAWRRGYDLLGHDGRQAAMSVGMTAEEVEEALLPVLPTPRPQEDEMADVRWFHRDFVAAALAAAEGKAGASYSSIALMGAKGFCFPGQYSLASRLIKGWLAGGSSDNVAPAMQVQDATAATATATTTATATAAATAATAASAKQEGSGSGASGEAWLGDLVPQVSLDVGVFKYTLMRLTDESSGRSKLLVWGDTRAAYHNNVLQACKSYVHRAATAAAATATANGNASDRNADGNAGALLPSFKLEPLGGGRIEHHPEQGVCHVFGYSAAFGPAPHEVAAALVRRWHPFTTVTTSYDGY